MGILEYHMCAYERLSSDSINYTAVNGGIGKGYVCCCQKQ